MVDGDAFESLYGRLEATRLTEGVPPPAGRPPTGPLAASTPVRRASSRLLPRMQDLAPHRRRARRRPRDDD